MKVIALIAGCATAALSMVYLSSVRSHQRLHEKLMIKNVAIEGASIGVVVDQIRNSSQMPVQPEDFTRRYAQLCRINWHASTNTSGDVILSLQGKDLWSIRRPDGRVRRIGAAQPCEIDLLRCLEALDFSRPCSASNRAALEGESWSALKNESDKIWAVRGSGTL